MSVYRDPDGSVVLRCDGPTCQTIARTSDSTPSAARMGVRAIGWASRYRGGSDPQTNRWDYCARHAAGHPPTRRDRELNR